MVETTQAPPTTTGWAVTLYVLEPDASSAEDAVERLMERVLDQGLRGFAYAVEDLTTGEMSFVERGEVYTREQYLAKHGSDGDGEG